MSLTEHVPQLSLYNWIVYKWRRVILFKDILIR